jgi:hypothetical protein
LLKTNAGKLLEEQGLTEDMITQRKATINKNRGKNDNTIAAR